jgi:hypothetical protein
MSPLKNLDAMIGFVLVMSMAGTVVTATTQLLLTLGRMRGRYLARALADLLAQLDSVHLTPRAASQVAEAVLRHPLIARPGTRATSLHCDEFIRLLGMLADDDKRSSAPPEDGIRLWYGRAMMRATERYRRHAKLATAAISLALVLTAHIDSADLLRLRQPVGCWSGLLLSWMLLSLGAPFWYDRLKDLLHLRS